MVLQMKKQIIAVLEDDESIREEVAEALRYQNYDVVTASNAATLMKLRKRSEIDLYLIDLGLPDANGLDLVRQIRSEGNVGVIVLSGRTGETDKIVGLEIGADDYVGKPFSPRELCARVSSVLRRSASAAKQEPAADIEGLDAPETIVFGDWELKTGSRQVISRNKEVLSLTSSEYDLLIVFLKNRNRVLSRDNLITLLKGRDWAGYDRAMDGLVSRLRRKLSKHQPETDFIKTVHGVGYLFPDTV